MKYLTEDSEISKSVYEKHRLETKEYILDAFNTQCTYTTYFLLYNIHLYTIYIPTIFCMIVNSISCFLLYKLDELFQTALLHTDVFDTLVQDVLM